MSFTGSPKRLLAALADYDFTGEDEQAIREQWIYPLLNLLGYGLGTMNPVDIPFKVDLASPIRALGSHRMEVDYRPTVHGVGLCIIEAKRPNEDLFSELHIGQAWSYATHPRVDVPFIVLANGARLGVFDLGEDDWDTPILDIQQSELPDRFAELAAVLAARQITGVVRRRQLRHLRRALSVQIDEEALNQTIRDVQAIAEELRPAVREKQAAITSEAWAEQFERWTQNDRDIGVWGIAFGANSVRMPVVAEVLACVELILGREPDERTDAFDEMLSVARVNGTIRQCWPLHVLRLSVALRCVGADGCDNIARDTATKLARDAAETYPGYPVMAAAHQLWCVLPAFICRLALVYQADPARAQVEQARAIFDVERFLRDQVLEGLSEEAMLAQTVDMMFRRVWTSFDPWSVENLQAAESACRNLLDVLPPSPPGVRIGQVNNENFTLAVDHDPLVPITRNLLQEVAEPRGEGTSNTPSFDQQMFAAELLTTYFGEAGRPDMT
jgi:hypothetical protein